MTVLVSSVKKVVLVQRFGVFLLCFDLWEVSEDTLEVVINLYFFCL